MSAPLAATPSDAPAPDVERHTWLESLSYHMLPGFAPLAGMLALAPVMEARGWPPAMALFLGAFTGVLPVQLGILYYLGWKRNGRLSLEGIVLLRKRVPAGQMLLLVLGLFLWSGLVFGLLSKSLDGLLLPAFEWLPPIIRPLSDDFTALPRSVALATLAVGFVGTAWLAPFVEELYFRGFLLPRLPLSRSWAPLVNAILFSLYHFWSPWQAFSRILMVTPMNYAVQKKESLWVSVATHLLLNTVGLIPALLAVL